MFRDGDVYDKKYQARLFDTFLVAVYVYDDDLRLVFSFSVNKNTIQIPIESAVNAVENNAAECSFKLCSAPPKQKTIHRMVFLFYWWWIRKAALRNMPVACFNRRGFFRRKSESTASHTLHLLFFFVRI